MVKEDLKAYAGQVIRLSYTIHKGAISSSDTLKIYIQKTRDDVYHAELSENATVGSVLRGVMFPLRNITYSLENDYEGRFIIDNTTGTITLGRALDYETTSKYELSVEGTSDAGTKTRVAIVMVKVKNINDNNPVIPIVKPKAILEVLPAGSHVLKVSIFNEIHFSIRPLPSLFMS